MRLFLRRLFRVAALAVILPASLWADGSPRATLVVITGLGGEPRYDESFQAWAATLIDAAAAGGLGEETVVYLAGDPDRDPRAKGRSTRDNVQATLADLASKPEEGPLFVVVIGHGSHRDGVTKVNLPGPDMTASDFATALAPFGERPIVFANLTSASGGFVRELSAPGRVIITATRSATERNASVFARFFAAAFVGDAADVDHDGRLSMLEVFTYSREEVKRIYEREQKLQTEHAVLDDNGDGEGSAEPGVDADDGRLAAVLTLTGPRSLLPEAAAKDPDLARLYQQKVDLVQAVAELRRQKEELAKDAYEARLEELLVQLALANREIRAHDPESGDGS